MKKPLVRDLSIVFIGGENAVKSSIVLEALMKKGYNIILVLSERSKQRKEEGMSPSIKRLGTEVLRSLYTSLFDRYRRKIKTSPLSEIALSYSVPHLFCEDRKLREYIVKFRELGPDFIISCGWGFKIPMEVIEIAKIAALNCHSSYLPRYKGGSVFYHVLANMEKETGATVHFLTREFDEGNILTQEKLRIYPDDTPHKLLFRISDLTVSLLEEAFEKAAIGDKGFEQDSGDYFPRLSPKDYALVRSYNKIAKSFGLPLKRLKCQKS